MRSWVIFCHWVHEDPWLQPFDPQLVIYWIADRVQQIGHIKSLRQWTAMLSWLCQLDQVQPLYQSDITFCRFIKALKKQYDEEADPRLPFKPQHIIQYTKHLIGSLSSVDTASYNALLIVTIIQTFFFTMCRPSELLLSPHSSTKWSLTFPDIHKIKQHQSLAVPSYYHFTIRSFKNQKTRKVVKNVYLGNTRFLPHSFTKCTDSHCSCHILNPAFLISKLIQRQCQSSNTPKYLFCNESGSPISTTDFTNYIRTMTTFLHLPEPHRYTPYSLRIGGTTCASSHHIPDAKILQYVGWRPSKLPQMSHRYTRFDQTQLQSFASEMIHSPLTNTTSVYDPWTTKD